MKKFDFKNCIAFTLAEMTLVLLITSIIAAASTPMITSAISGSNGEKGNNDLASTFGVPWRSASAYNAGGIYNAPEFMYSIISIGHKTGSSPDNYGYPALIVQQNSGNNFVNAPQIKIIPRTSTAPDTSYTNIAMDEFQNVAITYGSSFQAEKGSNSFMGYGNVFLGSYINSDSSMHGYNYISSVFMGYGIDVLYTDYAVTVGSNIYARDRLSEGILIGNRIRPVDNVTLKRPIYIGNHAGYSAKGDEQIFIGNFAGFEAGSKRSIMIGNHAGQSFERGASKDNTYENIIIGSYAGFVVPVTLRTASSYSNNVIIGHYAGASVPYWPNIASSPTKSKRSLTNNVMIGYNAGKNTFNSYPVTSNSDSIYIGRNAGWTNFSSEVSNLMNFNRKTCIGYRACYVNINASDITSDKMNSDSIYIGEDSGYNVNNDGGYNILIGRQAGKNMGVLTNSNVIAIGDQAGTNSSGKYSIYIGNMAGNGSSTGENAGYRRANVGLGNHACRNITKGGKWCLGGVTINSVGKVGNVEVWNKDEYGPQMVIGFTDGTNAYDNQTITFYASYLDMRKGDAYKSMSLVSFSDRRLKKDIVPTKHSIDDIRKVNIYDFNFKNDKDKKLKTGVIAQEYRKVFPQDVSVEPYSKKLAVSPNWLLFTLVNAVKDLDKEITNLQKGIDNYVADYLGLKSKVEKLEKQAALIKSENAQMKKHLAKINSKLK